ncbi:hypothetical protein [Neobacillus sp. NPDC093127]|uniref:hypothetical protein n=1 Tax=Neobacillus sp. NPDC093127 TaxID=3364296 RepID=UPI00381AB9E6
MRTAIHLNLRVDPHAGIPEWITPNHDGVLVSETQMNLIVIKGKRTVVVDNPTNFPLIGIGAQGAVYRISEEQCVKLYGNLKHAKREHHGYSFSREQDRPLELFKDLRERGFLDSFLKQVKAIDRKTYTAWTKKPFPLPNKGSK